MGIVVAKKNVAKAHSRNRIKRVVREAFRHHKDKLGDLDLVVLVRFDADRLNNARLSSRLTKLFSDIGSKSPRPSMKTA